MSTTLAQRLKKLEERRTSNTWDREAVALSVASTVERLSRGEYSGIDPETEARLDKLAATFFPLPKSSGPACK